MMTMVRMAHIRRVHMCSRGARHWFARHGLDWPRFLREGIDADTLRATGDAMALRVVEEAERG